MERVTSTEDVKWGIDGGQQAFSRNGSELGLQEFVRGLSSIPSFSSCLAQLGDSTLATCGGDDKTVQAPAFSTIGEGQGIPSTPEAEAGAQPAGQLPTNLTPEAYSRGIARVPSLEVMKMFMGPPNHLHSPTVPLIRRPEQQSASEAFGGGASPMNGVQQIPTSVTTALLQGGVIPPAPHSAILTMNPAVAAAAFSQLTNGGVMPQTMDMELLEKSEQRRKRRMLSNRESARRSRKRKQEHLHTLEEERDRLREEKSEWLQSHEKLTRRCLSAEEECVRLKDENKRLREELRILGLVKSELFQSRKQLAAGNDEEESEK